MTIDFTPLINALADTPFADNELCRVFHGRGHSVEALSHINLDFYPPSLFLVKTARANGRPSRRRAGIRKSSRWALRATSGAFSGTGAGTTISGVHFTWP